MKSLKNKTLFMVAVCTLSLIFSLLYYSSLEDEERKINQQIGITLSTERHAVAIEKQVYYDIVHGESSQTYIQEEIDFLMNLYESSYKGDIFRIISEKKTLEAFGDSLNQLSDTFPNLENFDFQTLLSRNNDVKQELIKAIRTHSDFSSKVFYMMATGLVVLFSILIYLGYKEIVKPLEKITYAINQQHHNLSMDTINDIQVNNEISLLVDEYNQLVKQHHLMVKLIEKIHEQHRFEDVFNYIYESLETFIPYDRIGIAMVSNKGKSLEALTAKSKGVIKLNSGYKQNISASSLKQVIENHEVRIINDLEAYYKDHPFSDSTRLVLEEGMLSSITLPLFHDEEAIGVVFFSSMERHAYNEDHQLFLVNIANALSTSLEKSFIFENLMISTVRGFAKMVESKDNITGNHIDRISHYSDFISCILEDRYEEIDDHFIKSIKRLSPLHDIGKVSIPDYILNKPGKLTDDEMAIMRGHSLHGAEVLEELLVSIGVKEFTMAVDIAKYHHEKVDGRGYPEGLTLEEIPLAARIVALADVFDALTSVRPYKKAFSFEEAIEIIKKDAGKHFDSRIVECLLDHVDDFKEIYQQLWSSSSF